LKTCWQNNQIGIKSILMNINKVKLYFQFYKSTLITNFAFSVTVSLVLYLIAKSPIIYNCALFFMSFGFIFAIVIKESSSSNRDEYYFYYNFSITKVKLFCFSYFLNVIAGLLVIAGYSYAKWIISRQHK
jgi:hypothetical protein